MKNETITLATPLPIEDLEYYLMCTYLSIPQIVFIST